MPVPPSNTSPAQVVLIDYDPILFSPMGDEAEYLAARGASWETHLCRSADDVLAVARDADVVAVQTVRPLLTREVLAQLTRCRCTIRAGAGYDSIDYKAATEMGIMVCNTPTYCTDDVADNAIAHILSSVRHLARLDVAMRQNRWARELAIPTRRITGSTLGIIGLGRIGSRVAKRMRSWDLTILAYDPYITQSHADSVGAQLVGLDDLLRRSDFVTIHCPLTDETYHLLSWDQFAQLKPGAFLVNTARGPIVHEQALVAALRDGRLAGAGIDVFEHEPPTDSPLLQIDSVTLTPHTSANSPESRRDLFRLICEVSGEVVQGRVPPFVVNPEVLSHLRQVG